MRADKVWVRCLTMHEADPPTVEEIRRKMQELATFKDSSRPKTAGSFCSPLDSLQARESIEIQNERGFSDVRDA